jgi:uncharacterized Ntn-hydrolase superfamily protein
LKRINIPKDFVNTFSIVAFDPKTKELGVAVASKFLAVGALVPWAKAGVGAIATQSWVNVDYGRKGLELMAQGKSASETVEILTDNDEMKQTRQAGFVDANGASATFTGSDCFQWAGGIAGENFACQGNILTGENVVTVMSETFQSASGDLAERLVKALQAGEETGGDSRGKQSAALLVVKENGGYGGFDDRYLDLRVDDHSSPVKELQRLLRLHELYFKKSNREDILKIEGVLKDRIVQRLLSLEYIKTNQPTDKDLFEALHSFHLIENFDERIQQHGFIDNRVVAFMDELVGREDLE